MTTFGDGVYQYGGEPVGGARFTNPWATTYFVDYDNGSAGNQGLKPQEAVTLPSEAVSLASAGDIIYVRPRPPGTDNSDVGQYADQILIPEAKYQLSMIGVNHGYNQFHGPFVRYATSGYVVDVSAPAFHLENMCIHKGGSITGAIRLRGVSGYATLAGSCSSTIENCQIRYGKLHVDGGYHTTVRNCLFKSSAPAVYYDASTLPTQGHRIIGCDFMANNGAALATAYVRLLGSHMEFFIRDCYFDQKTTADEYIYATGSNDGTIANCYFNDNDISCGSGADDEIRIGSGTMSAVGCYDNSGSIIVHS